MRVRSGMEIRAVGYPKRIERTGADGNSAPLCPPHRACLDWVMRRALSILLVLVFGMPALVPLLGAATSGDASIPACCRRHGQHHCLMSDSEGSMLQATGVAAPEFRAPAPKCPY